MIGSILLVTRHREWHRRLTYAAALCLVAPAATRWTLQLPYLDPLVLDIGSYVVMFPFLITLAFHDFRMLGRLHPATLTCIIVLVPVQIGGAWVARSDWWNGIAPWVLGSMPS